MLSAILSDQVQRLFGLAPIEAQSEHERAYAPLPGIDGGLAQDPDFVLPTTAGPLPWRLYYYSNRADVDGEWGYGRRASWPIRLCATNADNVTTVYVEREDGNGAQYVMATSVYLPASPRVFDTLIQNVDGSWEETRLDTGAVFRYPAGNFASLAYYQTPFGRRVTMSYNAHGYLDSIQEPAGRQLTYKYDAATHVYEVWDWAGRVRTLSYDENGNLSAVRDPAGYLTTFVYDCDHYLTQITDPTDQSVYFGYGADGRVSTRQIADEPEASYAWGGGLTVYTDPLGAKWTTLQDGEGNIVEAQDPVGATRFADYDPTGQPVHVYDALGNYTYHEYDVNGRETLFRDEDFETYYRTYDQYGNLLTEQDPLFNQHVYSYTYDPGGITPDMRRRVSAKDPLGYFTTYTYNGWGALASVQTPMGYITTYSWNAYGVLESEEDPLGHTRAYGYDAAGNRITETDEQGHVTTYTYDNLGRVTSVTNPVGAVRQTLYDGVGNVIATVDPLGNRSTYTYNARGLETSHLDARGQRWTTVYDYKGRETQRIDPLGNTTQSVWDDADRRVASVDGLGRRTTTIYDLAQHPIAVQDTAGLLHTTNYDAVGRVTEQVSPAGNITTTVYDAAGQMVATIDTAGFVHSIGYDDAGQVTSLTEPTGAITTTTYDPNGRAVESMDMYGYRATSIYDAAGQLIESIDPSGRRYTTVYDARGLRYQEYSPDGTAVQRYYDEASRNIANVDWLGWRTTTVYDLADRVVAFTDQYGKTVQDAYDPVGYPYASTDQYGNVFSTTYDEARRPVAYVDTLGNQSITSYDASNAVTMYLDAADDSEAYHYDDAGRYVATENALTQRTTIVYDPLYGRLAGQIDPLGGTTLLGYDGFGRWVATLDPLGNIWTTIFDDFGREVGVQGPTETTGNHPYRVLDLLNRPTAEVDQLGYRTTTTYDMLGRPVARMDALGYVTTHVYDFRGNLQAEIDALGYVTTHTYDLYSRQITTQNPKGYVATTVYDLYGRLSANVNARGYTISYAYDFFGRPLATMDALGQITTTVYDFFGRHWATQDQAGSLTTLVYDPMWRVQAQLDPLGFRTTTVYDPVGRVWANVDAVGRRTSHAYDAAGRLLGTMDPLGHITTTVYDSAGRAVGTVDPLNYRTSTVYDGAGRPTAHIDQLGYRTTSVYDARGSVIETIDALGYIATTTYDPLARVWAQQNGRGYRTTYSYDPVGSRIETLDPLGYRTSYVYDSLRQNVGIVDPLGYRVSMEYDPVGSLITRQDARGYVTTTQYDALNRAMAVIDAQGHRTTTSYDALSRPVESWDALNIRVTSVYDSVGNRLAVVNGLGNRTSHTYDGARQHTAAIDPLGRRHSYAYDAAGRLSAYTDALGQIATHVYDARGLETSRVYGDGSRCTFAYDARGSLTQALESFGLTNYTFDALARPLSVVPPLPASVGGAPSRPRGQLLAVPTGPYTVMLYGTADHGGAYDAGCIFTIDPTDPSGTVTVLYSFTGGSDGANPTTGLIQGSDGNLYGMTAYGGANNLGTVYKITTAGVLTTLHSFNGTDGQEPNHESLLLESGGYFWGVTSGLSSAANKGTIFKITSAGAFTLLYTFTNANFATIGGNPYCGLVLANDGNFYGTAQQGGTNGDGTLFQMTPTGTVTVVHQFANAYPNGRLIQLSDNALYGTTGSTGNGTIYKCTLGGTFTTLHTCATADGVYLVVGLLLGADGNLYATAYEGGANGLGTVYTVTTGGTLTVLHSFGPNGMLDGQNPHNHLIQLADGNLWGTTYFGGLYGQGTVFKCTTAGDFTVVAHLGGVGAWESYQYDAAGNRVLMKTPWGRFSYSYDARNQMTGLQDPGYALYGAAGGRSTWTYDARGLITREDWPNGTHATVTYDPNGRALQVRHATSANAEVERAFYGYDSLGNPLFRDTATGRYTYTYDAANQLTSEWNQAGLTTWTYDAANRRATQRTLGSLANTTYTFDAADELLYYVTGNSRTSFSYDANGQTTKVQPPTGNPTSYAWDGAHRLKSATTPANQRFSFTYDYNDLRVQKQGPNGTDSFLWDGQDPLIWMGPNGVAELTARGATLARVVGHRSGNVNLNRQYHTDALANVEAITDASQSTEVKPATDAWGNLLSGSATDQPYDYTGGLGYWHDPDLNLQYVRARWLDPATGHWMSPDPVKSEPRYSYAHQMPTTQVDPSGTQSFSGMAAAAFSLSNPVYDYRGRIVGPGDPSLRAALAGYVPPPGRAGYELMGTSPANAQLVPIARTPQEAAALNAQAILDMRAEIAADQVGVFDRAVLGILSTFGLSSERAHKILQFIKELGSNVLAGINQFLGMLGGFVKSATAGFNALVDKLPSWLKNILPVGGGGNVALYVFGIVAGIFDHIVDVGRNALMTLLRKLFPAIAIVEMVGGILETVLFLFQNGISWEMVFDAIKDAALGPFNQLIQLTHDLAGQVSLHVFDRGRKMASFMSTLLLAIVQVIKVTTQGRDFARSIKEFFQGRSKKSLVHEPRVASSSSTPRDHVAEVAKSNVAAENQIAAKISVSNRHQGQDRQHGMHLSQYILNHPVASRAYRFLQREGIEVSLEYGPAPDKRTMGGFDAAKGKVTIYMQNHMDSSGRVNSAEVASTMIHEYVHARTAKQQHARGTRIYTQAEEYRAMALEYFFVTGKRPDVWERSRILTDIRRDPFYSTLPAR